jgi:hypothetical protein
MKHVNRVSRGRFRIFATYRVTCVSRVSLVYEHAFLNSIQVSYLRLYIRIENESMGNVCR